MKRAGEELNEFEKRLAEIIVREAELKDSEKLVYYMQRYKELKDIHFGLSRQLKCGFKKCLQLTSHLCNECRKMWCETHFFADCVNDLFLCVNCYRKTQLEK